MPKIHIVKQGEHLSSIAERYSFVEHETLWNHPDNAALKDERSPHVLLPGDEVIIPDKESKSLPRPTGALHSFRIGGDRLTLRLRLLGTLGEPLAETDCELTVEGSSLSLRTDPDGVIEATIPRSARQGSLAILDITYELAIGHLDPAKEPSGLSARLNNLGYYSGEVPEVETGAETVSEGAGGPNDEEERRFAIACFERDSGLPVSGNATAAMASMLEAQHGC